MTILVAIEGSDGSGKTTLIHNLQKIANDNGFETIKCGFHDQAIVKKIINNFENEHSITKEMLSVCLWISASFTMEKLKKNDIHIIFCDRYDLTGRLYDNFTGISSSLTDKNASLLPIPDIYIYLDISPETALNRVLLRSKRVSFFETMQQYTFKKDNSKWQELYKNNQVDYKFANMSFLEKKEKEREFALEFLSSTKNSLICDASQPVNKIVDECWEVINSLL